MKRNAALVVAFLCLVAFIMPWGWFVSDPFYVHTYSILASTMLVIACNRLSGATWSILVQVAECTCIIYQSQLVMNWDNPVDGFYYYHDEFMLSVFILELLFISSTINKIVSANGGIASYLRRAFLSFVYIYPGECSGIGLHYDSGRAQC